ncbi:MAG: L-seryl-tRNA(Sec) selenium transferase [Deltaproteobacteria bacterium]|nr:L-seryl-tRNA(Sec) selenium transferase [Deltaproteobacteria bacterium]
MPSPSLLRRLPKVDQLLLDPEMVSLQEVIPRPVVLKAVRQILDQLRNRIRKDQEEVSETDIDRTAILKTISSLARELNRPHLRRIINATGVIIHTNLGRSLLAEEAVAAIRNAGFYYENLEYDLASGQRGSRYSHVEGLLCELTGAEAALVVNNNAAAVYLALQTLAAGREVVVSRGELVEIGGSFRIPEVMSRSGAHLVEIGTTNKTHLHDYQNAVTDRTSLLLKVHQSNFHIIGFTTAVDIRDLVELARTLNLPVMEDLGSGCLLDLSPYGVRREPTVRDSVSAGIDVTTFSGDKLLGGPQAGLLVGRRQIIDQIKKNPINRAMRIDKLTLAALEATLRLYFEPERALSRIPTLRMITTTYQTLRRRAARLKKKLDPVAGPALEIGLIDGQSQIGGGALPGQDLPTRLVTLRPVNCSVNDLEAWLRTYPIPIITRIEHDQVVLDVRTMTDDDFDQVRLTLADVNTLSDLTNGKRL